MSFVDDLNNLDWDNPGLWPTPFKIAVSVLLFIAALGVGWYFDTQKQQEQLQSLEKKESEKIEDLKRKQRKVANIDLLREQMEEMEQSFGDMVRQLPDKTEVASLLVDISQTGVATGLEFNLFKPQAEKSAEFYVTLPIEISVTGGYHQLGEFISGVAALPRIVTAHNIDIKALPNSNALEMKAIAQTYRAEEIEKEDN